MKSVIRIRESGLAERWDHWANWANQVQAKLFIERNNKSDIRNLFKLSSPLITYVVLCVSGVALFTFEIVKFC